MTYRKLKEEMNLLNENELDQTAIVYDGSKYFEIGYWTLSELYERDLPLDDL